MPHEFIGHVNLHWQPAAWWAGPPLRTYESLAKEVMDKLGVDDGVVVQEYGTRDGHVHFHYWLKTAKSKPTVIAAIKSVFSTGAGAPPAQFFSCKVANQQKLADYFKYLAKGPYSEVEDQPLVLYDKSGSRMVSNVIFPSPSPYVSVSSVGGAPRRLPQEGGGDR